MLPPDSMELAESNVKEGEPTERFELPTAGLQIRSTTSYATLALSRPRCHPFLNRTVKEPASQLA